MTFASDYEMGGGDGMKESRMHHVLSIQNVKIECFFQKIKKNTDSCPVLAIVINVFYIFVGSI